MLKRSDIQQVIKEYNKGHKVHLRDASYDFCYSYFQLNRGNLSSNMEHSCWVLWGYLASWGMLRNSKLMKCSPAALKPLIKYLDNLKNDNIWDIDVPDYKSSDICSKILKIFTQIAEIVDEKIDVSDTITLITKIMMGVFGCVPAYDANFTKAFKSICWVEGNRVCAFSVFNNDTLECILDFYNSNKVELDKVNIYAINFSGVKTNVRYKIAKLIDMYGFAKGEKE